MGRSSGSCHAYARRSRPKAGTLWTARGGARPQCGPVRRYKDSLKQNMKTCEMQPSTLSIDSQGRSNCRSQCQEAVKPFEDARVAVLQHKRAVRKGEAQPTSNLGAWPCDSCSRICHSRIGLYCTARFGSVQPVHPPTRALMITMTTDPSTSTAQSMSMTLCIVAK